VRQRTTHDKPLSSIGYDIHSSGSKIWQIRNHLNSPSSNFQHNFIEKLDAIDKNGHQIQINKKRGNHIPYFLWSSIWFDQCSQFYLWRPVTSLSCKQRHYRRSTFNRNMPVPCTCSVYVRPLTFSNVPNTSFSPQKMNPKHANRRLPEQWDKFLFVKMCYYQGSSLQGITASRRH